MIVKLLTEHNLEFLSLKVGYRGSSESTHVKMPHCWKSHALGSNYKTDYPLSLCSEQFVIKALPYYITSRCPLHNVENNSAHRCLKYNYIVPPLS